MPFTLKVASFRLSLSVPACFDPVDHGSIQEAALGYLDVYRSEPLNDPVAAVMGHANDAASRSGAVFEFTARARVLRLAGLSLLRIIQAKADIDTVNLQGESGEALFLPQQFAA